MSEQIQEKRAEVITLRQRYLPKHPARIQEEAIYTDLLKRFGREIKRSSVKPSEKSYWFEYKEQMDALEKIVETDDQWQALCTVVGRPDWAADPALAHLAGRHELHDAIDHGLSLWVAERSIDQGVSALIAAGVPAGRVVDGRNTEAAL